MKWTTKIGRVMVVSDMRRSHIINAIEWLIDDERYGQLWKDDKMDVVWVNIFLKELISRGQSNDAIRQLVVRSRSQLIINERRVMSYPDRKAHEEQLRN